MKARRDSEWRTPIGRELFGDLVGRPLRAPSSPWPGVVLLVLVVVLAFVLEGGR